MRQHPDSSETYEEWVHRASMYEKGRALQRIANGESIDLVLEEFSRRLADKMLHPVLIALKQSYVVSHDSEEHRRSYEENYIKKFGRKPDHVSD